MLLPPASWVPTPERLPGLGLLAVAFAAGLGDGQARDDALLRRGVVVSKSAFG